ncbi:PLC-like phosphodiesterase, partial [Blyttiomyces helicus]
YSYSAHTLNVDLLELDCHMTKDGKAVVIHDENLGRLCGTPDINVSKTNYADLPPLLLRPELSPEARVRIAADPDGTRIPLLSELLAEFPRYPMQIDVKDGPEALVIDVGNQIIAKGRELDTVWGSFKAPISNLCRVHFGTSIPLMFTVTRMLQAYAMWGVGALGWMELDESAMVAPYMWWLIRPGFLEALNRRGVAVIVFGGSGALNTVEEYETVAKLGANGICTDRPALLTEWLKSNRLNKVEDFYTGGAQSS